MKILFCGDIVGRSGRDAVLKHLPSLRKELALDAVIVNADNAASGFGITPAIARELFAAGTDVITGGDHIWDQKEIIPYLAQERRLLRCANFPDATPGSGCGIFTLHNGKKIFVIHLLGQVFHKENAACPFATANALLKEVSMPGSVQAILVDMHAEATSEKMAMGQHLDGRVSAVLGSHTHVPTHDCRIMKKGTAYQTDTGMCGDYDSIIGFAPAGPMERFLSKIPKARMEPAAGTGSFMATLVETNDHTGLATSITPIRQDGVLCS